MADIFNMLDTWNASGTTFTAIKMNVTDTASAAASLLLDLQVGGVSQFNVSKAGTAIVGNAGGSGGLRITNAGSFQPLLTRNGDGGLILGFFGGVTTLPIYFGSNDVALSRDAANTLAQRNSTNPQAFNLYNTYTDASNYERGFMQWVSNTLQIGTDKLGTGTARQLEFFTNGVARVRITSDGTLRGLSGYIYNLTSITGIWAAAAGSSYFGTESNHAIHIRTNNVERFAFDTVGSVRVSTALTVATLPATPLVGMVARVTDATAPVVGTTVTGGGAVAALCWYNGTNWTVIGV